MAMVLKDPEALRDADEIRKGIELARQEIELSMTDLRNQVARTFDVKDFIRTHPAAVLGGAFALGFALGFRWGE